MPILKDIIARPLKIKFGVELCAYVMNYNF